MDRSTYLSKYQKYKSKYLKLKESYGLPRLPRLPNEGTYNTHIDFPDIERNSAYFDDDQLVTTPGAQDKFYPTDISDLVDTPTEEEDTVDIFEITPISEFEDYQRNISRYDNKVIDIGLFGLIRGRQQEKYQVGDDDFVSINEEPNNNKILMVNNIDDFDEFTYRYGGLAKYADVDKEYGDEAILYIKWNKVAKNYKGFYLDVGIADKRQQQAFYKDKGYKSWWSREYPFENIIMFEPWDFTLFIGVDIDSPFEGKIYGANDFTQQDYTDIFTDSTDKKVVKLDSFKSFDTFTNKYGSFDENKVLVINWDKVADKYKGFYIDPDSEIYPKRYITAYFNDKKHRSWWRNDDIKAGYVYLFSKKESPLAK